MAVFGVQVVITMITASVVHKLSPYYSFGRWFITRQLYYYTFVSSQANEATTQTPVTTNKPANKSSKKTNNRGSAQRNKTNKNGPVMYLKECTLTSLDTTAMHYSEEVKWMLDLLVTTLITFIGTAVYFYISPSSLHSQMNLSIVWIVFLMLYTVMILFRLMQIYLDPKLPKERMSQIVLSLLMTMCLVLVLVFDSSVFDFKLTDNLNQINSLVTKRFNMTLEADSKPVPMWCLKGFIGIISTVVALILIFPTLNYARIHFELLKTTKSFPIKCLQNISFILPLVCGSMWIKRTSRTTGKPNVTEEHNSIEYYKAVLILIFCLSRFILFRSMMQMYLDRGKEYACNNKTDNEVHIKHKMTSIFIFYCCSATQYLGPVIILASSLFLYVISSCYFGMLSGSNVTGDEAETVSLFTASIFEGSVSFLTWWICFCMFILSSIGSIIHSYFQS